MGKRMIRDWTASEAIDSLSPQAEVFFTRLIMKADDFGNYVANIKLINAALFPLKEYKADQVNAWLSECIKAKLLYIYEADGKPLIHIENFDQKLRRMHSTYPPPPDGQARTSDGQVTDKCPPEEKRREVEEKKKVKEYGEPSQKFISIRPKYAHDRWSKIYSIDGLKDYYADNQSILSEPEHGRKFLQLNVGKVFNEFDHVFNSINSYIEKQYK